MLFVSVFISFLETFSISLIMFFASVATNFDIVHSNKYFNYAYNLSGTKSPGGFVVLLGFMLIGFYAARFILTTFYMYGISKYSQGRFHVLAYRFFNDYLKFNYKEFLVNHSSKIGKVIFADTSNLTQVMMALLSILAEGLTLIFIYVTLLYVNLKMTMVLTLFLTVNVFFILKAFSDKLKKGGYRSQLLSAQMSLLFSETYGNFKLIKLFARNDGILKKFHKMSLEYININTFNVLLQNLPRLILETIGFSMLISVMIYVVYFYQDVGFVIPILSLYAMAFYRFLPSANKILSSYNIILFTKHSLDSIEEYLKYGTEELGTDKVFFKKTIELKNLTFSYNPGKEIIKDINLVLEKRKKIAFVGESGAGKSTLADVIMGLYKPDQGQILIDGQVLTGQNISSWRSSVGYIPQNIFLFDGSVASNVIFGRDYDEAKLISVLRQAKIYDFLMQKEGLETRVGENGVMLSGGQKQRIAIARALYGNPEILILDEATSSLDNQTEEKIMDEIYQLEQNKTLIIIAHRLSTVQRCDKIYKVEGQKVFEVDFQKHLALQNQGSKEVVL
ncbi:MAG: ABC transporter ATP-binding protein [bacterium]